MGSVIESIKDKINTSSIEKNVEDIKIVDFNIKVADSSYVTKQILQEILNAFPDRDNVEITILNEANDGLQVSKTSDWDTVDLDNYYGEAIDIIGHINKNISSENIISIYSYEKFCETIKKKSVFSIMSIFSQLLMGRDEIFFEVQDQNVSCMTKSIYFSKNLNVKVFSKIDRKEILQLVRDNANFRNIFMYSLLPQDFSFQVVDNKNEMSEIFEKIETLLAVCYIANDAEIIDNNIIRIKISGQRNISMDINIKDIVPNREIVKIYNWIYDGGNATDKAVIARNIISLHCRYSNILNLDGKTYSSIQSNFNLYQRDNVDRYLNLKNDVGKSVTDIIEKSNDLAFDISRGMKNNILAIFTFMFTVILANIVSDVPLDNIFTRDITVIFEITIVLSFVVVVLDVYETNYKIRQMKKGFEKLKSNYTDVFDEQELESLMEEKSFNEDVINNIKRQRNMEIVIWVLVLIILLIVIETISSSPTNRVFIKLLEGLLKQ